MCKQSICASQNTFGRVLTIRVSRNASHRIREFPEYKIKSCFEGPSLSHIDSMMHDKTVEFLLCLFKKMLIFLSASVIYDHDF